ncbi:hypothetical protein A2911_02410 [Candidatus Nomurabacteria bacterium RIFCSPLOWO2_01_FULL_40_15]|uniref:acylphosphatase n=1 Tax=Candidatus Nomurabacteria bacterium RIFCSPLOWO2_01_FULL_40_15 TaxID=1801772 RepID=A0A1F6X7R6_9BACT|nr:MAG: hypothetical protein A2911_02410 [Candidatus Nomurabacteria bacterium RIFCSPLOWO2_01_FULL_40_15]
MKTQLHSVVTGEVQGVMFRDFVQRKARSLGIVGTVKNQPNGSVEVIAVGEKERLEELLKMMHKGPLLTRIRNRVDGISIEWGESTQNFYDFKIIY